MPTLDEWWSKAYPDPSYRQWVLDTWGAAFERAKKNKADITPIEYNVTCKSGEVLTVLIGGVMFGDDFLATFVDITSRKKAEKEILSLNNDLEALNLNLEEQVDLKTRERNNFFNLSNELLLTASSDGYFKDVNPSMLRVLGWSIDELTKHPFFNFIHPDDAQRTQTEYEQQVNEGKRAANFLNRYRCKDGSYRWLDWNATTEADGTIYASARDVTERKTHEENIKKLNKQNELILSSAGEGIYGVDLNGNTTFINPAAAKMLGWKVEDLLGKPQHEVIHHHYHDGRPYPKEECPVFTSFEDSQIHHVENEVFWRKDGTSFPVYYVTTPVIDEGEITGAVITFQDITERKRMEEAVLKERAKSIAAEAATKAKSSFLASMSHDIRTPMNAILGMGEMLADSRLDDEQRHYINIINNSGNGLLALINDILDLSKIEAGQLELESIPFDPKQLATYSVETLKINALNRGIGMTVDVDNSVPMQILGDPARLQQIILNLLSNAVKFTSRGKIVLSVVKTEEKIIRFSVSDTGIGIPENKQQTIFQPFRQADSSTTRRFGGTGLGLSICEKLISNMGGKIWVVSQPNVGSTFHFAIPCHEAKPLDATQSGDSTQPYGEQEGISDGLSILLADDAEENCMVIEAFLKSTNHRLTIVENGLQALDEYKSGNFDIVLMDVHMPEMDGYEATKAIRSFERETNQTPVPVLALTANAMKEDIKKTRKAGCNLHLSKPIRKQLLLDTIKQFC